MNIEIFEIIIVVIFIVVMMMVSRNNTTEENERKLNPDYKLRDDIIFGEPVNWFGKSKGLVTSGGCLRFDAIDLDTLEKLFKLNFIDPEDYQNNSPTSLVFLEFMRKYPQVKAHGYAISPQRGDYRVSIEGLECDRDITPELIADFRELCERADELDVSMKYLRSWWD